MPAKWSRDVAELYEPLAEEAGVQLVVHPPSAALPLHGSRELLGQALSNLVDNAIKYGAPPNQRRGAPARP